MLRGDRRRRKGRPRRARGERRDRRERRGRVRLRSLGIGGHESLLPDRAGGTRGNDDPGVCRLQQRDLPLHRMPRGIRPAPRHREDGRQGPRHGRRVPGRRFPRRKNQAPFRLRLPQQAHDPGLGIDLQAGHGPRLPPGRGPDLRPGHGRRPADRRRAARRAGHGRRGGPGANGEVHGLQGQGRRPRDVAADAALAFLARTPRDLGIPAFPLLGRRPRHGLAGRGRIHHDGEIGQGRVVGPAELPALQHREQPQHLVRLRPRGRRRPLPSLGGPGRPRPRELRRPVPAGAGPAAVSQGRQRAQPQRLRSPGGGHPAGGRASAEGIQAALSTPT